MREANCEVSVDDAEIEGDTASPAMMNPLRLKEAECDLGLAGRNQNSESRGVI